MVLGWDVAILVCGAVMPVQNCTVTARPTRGPLLVSSPIAVSKFYVLVALLHNYFLNGGLLEMLNRWYTWQLELAVAHPDGTSWKLQKE